MPRPLIASKLLIVAGSTFASLALSRMPRAIGCSESPSTESASESTLFSAHASSIVISTTPNSPLVSVPVLSNTIMSIRRASSNARRSRTKIPFFAPIAVLIATTSGIAKPSA